MVLFVKIWNLFEQASSKGQQVDDDGGQGSHSNSASDSRPVFDSRSPPAPTFQFQLPGELLILLLFCTCILYLYLYVCCGSSCCCCSLCVHMISMCVRGSPATCVCVWERSPFLHSIFLVLSCSHDHLHGIFVNEFLIGFFLLLFPFHALIECCITR